MHSILPVEVLLALSILICSSPGVQAQDLLTALNNHNASRFAAFLEASPDLILIITSGSVRTIFAPIDEFLEQFLLPQDITQPSAAPLPSVTDISASTPGTTPSSTSSTSSPSSPSSSSSSSSSSSTSSISTLSSLTTTSVPTQSATQPSPPPFPSENAGYGTSFDPSIFANEKTTKRQSGSGALLPSDFTTVVTGIAANLGGENQVVVSGPSSTNSSALIYSGLGHTVRTVQQFIPFDGGYIHTIDGILTIPNTLSTTTLRRPDTTTFRRLLGRTNLTTTFDKAPSTTFFIPSNQAWQNWNGSVTSLTMNSHVVPNFRGYLPSLNDSTILTTRSGSTLRIRKENGETFVNGARIIAPNVILENGVAHIIEKVIPPVYSPVFTGTSASLLVPGYKFLATVVSAVALFMLKA